jgi:hypothetical protein
MVTTKPKTKSLPPELPCILDSPIPKPASGTYLPCIPSKLKPGDRIKQSGDPFELVFRSYEPASETLSACFTLPNKTLKTVRVSASSILVNAEETIYRQDLLKKPDIAQAVPTEQTLKLGDRVIFRQHWNGVFHEFEGTVQKLNDPIGTALVNYDVPEHLQDGVERSQQLQAPIGIFALGKIPMDTPNEPVCPLTQERDRLLQSNLPPESFQPSSLEQERDRLLQSSLPPESAWLETCMASAGFRQAYWRSRAPCINGKKRQYIGKVNSLAHQRACEAVANRKRLAEVEKQLKILGDKYEC